MKYLATYTRNDEQQIIESETPEDGFATACDMFKAGWDLVKIERQEAH